MIRARLGQLALRAYPRPTRERRGQEMLGMLLDAGDVSVGLFMREIVSVLVGGLRERTAAVACAGTRRLLADSCCQAAVIWLAWLVRKGMTRGIEASAGDSTLQVIYIGAVVAIVCALLGFERIAGVFGACLVLAIGAIIGYGYALHAALVAFDHSTRGGGFQLVTLAEDCVLLAGPLVCFAVMTRAPRPRLRDRRRLLWLAPTVILAALLAHSTAGNAEFLAVISAAALLRLVIDPRLAIACGLVWTDLALSGSPTASPHELAGTNARLITAIAACAILAVAAARVRALRATAVT
jgi:hypothetical protein